MSRLLCVTCQQEPKAGSDSSTCRQSRKTLESKQEPSCMCFLQHARLRVVKGNRIQWPSMRGTGLRICARQLLKRQPMRTCWALRQRGSFRLELLVGSMGPLLQVRCHISLFPAGQKLLVDLADLSCLGLRLDVFFYFATSIRSHF